MVSHSGKLVSAAEDAIAAVNNKDREAFNNALERLYDTYRLVCSFRFTYQVHVLIVMID